MTLVHENASYVFQWFAMIQLGQPELPAGSIIGLMFSETTNLETVTEQQTEIVGTAFFFFLFYSSTPRGFIIPRCVFYSP